MSKPQYFSIDLGGTEIKYSLMNAQAELLWNQKIATPQGEDASFKNLMNVLVNIIKPHAKLIRGIALSAPGVIDSIVGHSFSGGSFWYLKDVNIPKYLEKEFQVPVTIENDGKAAALAELRKGSLKNVKNGAAVLLGTAVGGGLVINGELYRGTNFASGEISAIITNPLDELEKHEFLGWNGGSRAIVREVASRLNLPHDEIDGHKIFEKANSGESEVVDILNVYVNRLVRQLFNFQALLDLEVIAIGGGISRQPLLMDLIQSALVKLYEHHGRSTVHKVKITTCKYFNDSNLIGALLHHFDVTNT